MGVRERVNHSLSPIFRNGRLDDNQHIRTMPTVEHIGKVAKHLISYSLTVPCDHFHGRGIRSVGIILDSPRRLSPCCKWREALMPRCCGIDAIQRFYVPSLAQCVPNTTNGRLRFENMMM